ncbi:phage terminase small subunit [Streptomyces antimycoticus]
MAESGQSAFYEASDWALAVYLAEATDGNLKSGRFSARLLQDSSIRGERPSDVGGCPTPGTDRTGA